MNGSYPRKTPYSFHMAANKHETSARDVDRRSTDTATSAIEERPNIKQNVHIETEKIRLVHCMPFHAQYLRTQLMQFISVVWIRQKKDTFTSAVLGKSRLNVCSLQSEDSLLLGVPWSQNHLTK